MSRTLWLVVGIISILGGIFAFFNPLSASFAAEQLAGFVFLLVGILQFIALFRAYTTTGKVLAAIGGMLGSGNTGARIAKGALSGGATGAVYGAGGAETGERKEGAALGGLLGAGLGAAVPAVSGVAGAAPLMSGGRKNKTRRKAGLSTAGVS